MAFGIPTVGHRRWSAEEKNTIVFSSFFPHFSQTHYKFCSENVIISYVMLDGATYTFQDIYFPTHEVEM
jgi:hypothetical protein